MNFCLLRGSLFDLPLHLSVVVIASQDMTIRNDCRVVDVVIVASRSISLLASCAFTIIDAVNSLTAMGAHERPLFNELQGSIVSHRVFIRLQSLIAR